MRPDLPVPVLLLILILLVILCFGVEGQRAETHGLGATSGTGEHSLDPREGERHFTHSFEAVLWQRFAVSQDQGPRAEVLFIDAAWRRKKVV